MTDPALPPYGPANPWYDPTLAIWPDLKGGAVALAPVRVGMDRSTGKMLIGWPHVVQSMQVIFATRYHQRVLRRWVGSFVPHMLGESFVERIVMRFFWAISMALDLWEPDYRIRTVSIMAGNHVVSPGLNPTIPVAAEQVALGKFSFSMQGSYRPRAHLGDLTPEPTRTAAFVGRGSSVWDPL